MKTDELYDIIWCSIYSNSEIIHALKVNKFKIKDNNEAYELCIRFIKDKLYSPAKYLINTYDFHLNNLKIIWNFKDN